MSMQCSSCHNHHSQKYYGYNGKTYCKKCFLLITKIGTVINRLEVGDIE